MARRVTGRAKPGSENALGKRGTEATEKVLSDLALTLLEIKESAEPIQRFAAAGVCDDVDNLEVPGDLFRAISALAAKVTRASGAAADRADVEATRLRGLARTGDSAEEAA